MKTISGRLYGREALALDLGGVGVAGWVGRFEEYK
jgi:hypothetical protein